MTHASSLGFEFIFIYYVMLGETALLFTIQWNQQVFQVFKTHPVCILLCSDHCASWLLKSNHKFSHSNARLPVNNTVCSANGCQPEAQVMHQMQEQISLTLLSQFDVLSLFIHWPVGHNRGKAQDR